MMKNSLAAVSIFTLSAALAPLAASATEIASLGGENGAGTSAGTYRTTGPESAGESVTDASAADVDEEWTSNGFSMNYTNILYGPAIDGGSARYQPSADGSIDGTRPVFMKNFVSATYGFKDTWAVTATAYWWHRPVGGQELVMQDPFVRISNNSILSTDWGLNLYSDLRVHPGVTDASRQMDQIFGVQNFSYLSYQPGFGRLLTALRFSGRYNVHGRRGYGTDAEFYLAPEANYRLSPKFALTLLYEMGSSHQFGDDATYFTNDGTDLEPGFEWNPIPDMSINPYVTLQTGGKVSLASTSVGMFFSWTFL